MNVTDNCVDSTRKGSVHWSHFVVVTAVQSCGSMMLSLLLGTAPLEVGCLIEIVLLLIVLYSIVVAKVDAFCGNCGGCGH